MQYSRITPESLWSEISYYAVFRSTGILHIVSKIASNKWWCYIGVSLCVRRVSFWGAFADWRKATVRFVMSVRPSAWKNSAFSVRIFMKFYIWVFRKSVKKTRVWKFKLGENRTIITGTLHEGLCTFMISRRILHRIRNVLGKNCIGNQNKYFISNNLFPKILPFTT